MTAVPDSSDVVQRFARFQPPARRPCRMT